jgi:hypothetical protein
VQRIGQHSAARARAGDNPKCRSSQFPGWPAIAYTAITKLLDAVGEASCAIEMRNGRPGTARSMVD